MPPSPLTPAEHLEECQSPPCFGGHTSTLAPTADGGWGFLVVWLVALREQYSPPATHFLSSTGFERSVPLADAATSP